MIARIILGLWLTAVIFGAFFFAPPAEKLGELSRIIYFHVPVAWCAVMAFFWSMIQSALHLKDRKPERDIAAESAAAIGLTFCILATVSGMIFAKATWGAYWNWDPRETSVFILLLIYLAYFALRMAVDDDERRARLSAVYSILAFMSVPFLVFIIPRVYFSLHPSPMTPQNGKLGIDHRMLIVLLSSLAGFTGLFIWIQNLTVRLGVLTRRSEEENA